MKTRAIVAVAAGLSAVLALAACKAARDGLGTAVKVGGEVYSEKTGDPSWKERGNAISEGFKDKREIQQSEKYFIGRSVGASILVKPGYSLYDDGDVTEYVNLVGQSIAKTVDEVGDPYQGFHFAVVDSPNVDAFSLPGGFVFVSTGLLKATASEEELAGVLSHEIAHVQAEHAMSAIDKAAVLGAVVELGFAIGEATDHAKDVKTLKKAASVLDESVASIIDKVLLRGYDKSMEFDADAAGSRYLAKAGYSPDGVRTFLSHLPEGTGGGWGSTHPSPGDRMSRLSNLPAAFGAANPGAVAQRAARHQKMLERLK